MNQNTIRINGPIAPTYRWLRMNETAVPAAKLEEGAAVSAEIPAGVEESFGLLTPEIATGAGAEFSALAAALPARIYTVKAGTSPEDALRLGFRFPQTDAVTAEAVSLVLEADARLTVVMDYAFAEAAAQGAVEVKAQLGENALLRLVQIQQQGEEYTLFNDVGVRCAKDSRVELTRLILGGKTTYEGCRAALEGDGSSLDVKIGYLVQGEGRLDMNYEAVHTGKKTKSDINASGVLRDRASKLFRGTIDLKKGCAGAEGNENEDVLLMDEETHNQTVPVILCAEEDVVGNHGCTIGRLDENLIFYLQSRGMTPEAVYEMMAQARIDAVIRQIPDEAARKRLSGEQEGN